MSIITVERKVLEKNDVIAAANRDFERGNREQALQQLLQLREKIPTTDAVWIALAGMYVRLNRKTDALDAIRKAVELNPANKKQLPLNRTFEQLWMDPEFRRIMSTM